jgi:type I site-specific restriction-modification system R (restriction) subunit
MSNVCEKYKAFLNRAKTKWKNENFFSQEVIEAFKSALEEELNNKQKNKDVGNLEKVTGVLKKGVQAFSEFMAPTSDENQDPDNADFLALKAKRGKERKQSDTSFMTFANNSIKAVNAYNRAIVQAINSPLPRGKYLNFSSAATTF